MTTRDDILTALAEGPKGLVYLERLCEGRGAWGTPADVPGALRGLEADGLIEVGSWAYDKGLLEPVYRRRCR